MPPQSDEVLLNICSEIELELISFRKSLEEKRAKYPKNELDKMLNNIDVILDEIDANKQYPNINKLQKRRMDDDNTDMDSTRKKARSF